ncbi:hypothetical protein [Paenibacillus sp. 3LSP]|uniref:hypothetical protein n=1 Tax=Paenibacillus sp. 3LSP TaxID=2800795 RepID=UPI0039676EDC
MKSTTTISNIKSEFSLRNATSFGGAKVFLAYLEKIKLAQTMRGLSGGKAHNSIFPSSYPALPHRRLDARLRANFSFP